MSISSRLLLALFAVLSVGGVIEYALTEPGAVRPIASQGGASAYSAYVAMIR